MKEFIDYIFNENINYVLKDFNDKEIDEIKTSYRDYLEFQYGNVVNESNIDKAKIVFLKMEKDKFENADKIKKQIILLKDVALDEVRYFSDYARIYAEERRDNNRIIITGNQALSYIKQMEELVKHVRKFNMELANNLLEDSILDFNYAAGLSDNMSLRCARHKK